MSIKIYFLNSCSHTKPGSNIKSKKKKTKNFATKLLHCTNTSILIQLQLQFRYKIQNRSSPSNGNEKKA